MQAPLLHKMLLLVCGRGGRPYRQQHLPGRGLLNGAMPARGQAGVAALQSRQLPAGCLQCTACTCFWAGQQQLQFEHTAGDALDVTLLLSGLSQQQLPGLQQLLSQGAWQHCHPE